jgi:hypothetical protein
MYNHPNVAHDEEVPLPSPAEGRPTVAHQALTAAKPEAYHASAPRG